jgi:hypothetical protein
MIRETEIALELPHEGEVLFRGSQTSDRMHDSVSDMIQPSKMVK